MGRSGSKSTTEPYAFQVCMLESHILGLRNGHSVIQSDCVPRSKPGGGRPPRRCCPCGQRVGCHLQDFMQHVHRQMAQVVCRCHTAAASTGCCGVARACASGLPARCHPCSSSAAAAARGAQAVRCKLQFACRQAECRWKGVVAGRLPGWGGGSHPEEPAGSEDCMAGHQ